MGEGRSVIADHALPLVLKTGQKPEITLPILKDASSPRYAVGEAVLDSEVQPLPLPGAGTREPTPSPSRRALIQGEFAADGISRCSGSKIPPQTAQKGFPGRIVPERIPAGEKSARRGERNVES